MAKQTLKKIVNLSLAAVIGLSGLAVAAPILFAQPVSALSNTLYVANSGSDTSNDCLTQASPCQTINYAISQANSGDTVSVAAGTYNENVVVNKAVTLTGTDGASNTKIVATDANSSPLTFSTNGATVNGFTITHNYTDAELTAWNFNNNGVTFGQLADSNTLENSVVTLSRNGIYLNNNENNVITGNTITNNRTGINMVNDLSGTQITNNTISDNWTEGLVTYGSSIPANYSLVTVSGNTFDNNWYEEVTVKDASANSGTLDVSGNTFTDSPVTYSTSSDSSLNEPGFAAQQPTSLGGSATEPTSALPTLRIYDSGSVGLKYDSTKTIYVTNGQSIQDAIDLASSGDTISIATGTYNEAIDITKSLSLVGDSQTGVVVNQTAATSYGQGISIDGVSNVSISNMTINTPSGAPVSYALQAYQAPHLSLSNLTFTGPGKTGRNASNGKIGGVDVNSSSNVSFSNVSVSSYSKNGFAITSKYTSADTASANISFTNITTDSNNWAGLAFYTVGNDKSTNSPASIGGASSITGVTFSGHNSFTNNSSQGLFIEGGSDADFNSGSTPATYSVSGTGGLALALTGSTFSGNGLAIENYQTGNLIATSNYWGSAAPDFSTLISGTNVTSDPWFTDTNPMTTLSGTKTAPDTSGNATVDNSTPQVVVTDNTQPVTITVSSGTTNPGVDVSTLTTKDTAADTTTATLPKVTIQASTASVAIPASTVVTANTSNWDGVIAAPTVLANTSVSVPTPTGTTTTIATAIEVGAGNVSLTFNKAVRLVLTGQAGKLTGFIRNGDFTQISNVCSADDQTTEDTALAGGLDCYINVGNDMVIWTEHFTTFVAYSQAQNTSTSSSSTSTPIKTASAQTGSSSNSQVLGQSTSTPNSATSSTSVTKPAVATASAAAPKSGKILGVQWYIWLIALAALAVAAYSANYVRSAGTTSKKR